MATPSDQEAREDLHSSEACQTSRVHLLGKEKRSGATSFSHTSLPVRFGDFEGLFQDHCIKQIMQ